MSPAQTRAEHTPELLAICREVQGLARFTTEWNSGQIKPEPTSYAPMTPLLWHKLNAAIARASAGREGK